MTRNYTINGMEYNWKTGRPVQSELVENLRPEHYQGYGKDAAGSDFFLSYPLKRNEKEDSIIFQAVKYLPPKGESEGVGLKVSQSFANEFKRLQRENNDLDPKTENELIAEAFKGVDSIGKITMGSGMDTRYKAGTFGDKQNTKTKFYVELPIPNELSDSQSVTWDANKMNAFEVVASSVAIGAMAAPGATAEAVQKAITAARTSASAADFGAEGNRTVAGAVRAALAGLGLQAFGSNVTPNTMISRATGQILNSNTELLFNGVNLRTFTFNVTFAVRSKDESERVKKIIRSFKTSMAPKAGEEYVPGAGNFKGSGGIFLNAPDIFLIQYLKAGEEHPFLHKFKPCALTQLNVNYTGANVYSTYKDGTPTLIKMQMAFSEMNPIYAEDYAKAGDGVGY